MPDQDQDQNNPRFAQTAPITLLDLKTGLDQAHARIAMLEKNQGAQSQGDAAGNSQSLARVMKHMYDWLQHFGMPPLPAPKEAPPPPPPPREPPQHFDPFAEERDQRLPNNQF
jgi:hypothetical protein